MFQNFDLVSGLSVIILDFSDKKIVSFKVYTVTRKFYEYSEYWSTLIFFSVCGVVWWWLGRYKEPNGDWSIQFVEIVIAWLLMCQEILWKTNDTFLMRDRWSDGQSFDTFHIPHKLHWCQIQNMHACIRHASTFFKSFVYKVHASLCPAKS